MHDCSIVLKVFFNDPFWIGIFEYHEEDECKVYRHIFGDEPSDLQIYEAIQKQYSTFLWSPKIENIEKKKKANPKRMQRLIHRQLDSTLTIGTKAQQALKLQLEERKKDKANAQHKKKNEQKQKAYEKKREKRKQKHKGH